MAILTKARLTALTVDKLGAEGFNQALKGARNETRKTSEVTVFLSHSHDDLEKLDVNKVIVLLRSVGVRVYIDSNDPSLSQDTSAETAEKIKNQIEKNKKFILVATKKAIDSKWCNWELGFGDAHKYTDHIALVPIADISATWNGTEYLRIYPRIEESESTLKSLNVIFPDKRVIPLGRWLRM